MREGDDAQRVPPGRLGEVALLFLRLGLTAFGGPAAHIAMMEDEVVRRRGWLPREEFLDLLGATNLIPGPNSTELAIHLGHRRAGWPGLLVAGACFILPAMMLTLVAAWAYMRFGSLPETGAILYGVKPVIIAVVLQALWGLGRSALKTRPLAALALGSTVARALGVNELLVLVLAGAGAVLWKQLREGPPRAAGGSRHGVTLGLPMTLHALAAGATAAAPFSLGGLFLFFVKVGSVLFGSGYVLLAFLRADLVERWGWLTEAQLLDAVAVGQVTPGPVFTTATFIGYVVGGAAGAGLATLGIFLPAFVFVALSGPLVPRIRRSPIAGAGLDGVNAASLALMAVVTWQLGRSALVDGWTVALALVSGALLVRLRLNSAWLVLGGAALGLLVRGSVH
ncbi:chromate efflux transporter [Corallococcus praedator]|uniref:Chromate efflux transporter n=1 Tax=Corallococcus praedator TaxID=2316724 RepID=A0ABX9QG37_9BACT|nr:MULTISPECIES: chromate efflux transporter [Corallococcus]RKH31886.1 chromate efflux transporter [Corallococcus sp. CA031C]RKI02775.1 chromate efflux transporter [Corallococcus praedator]